MNYNLYTDKQIIDGILSNDRPVIEYFFCKKCSNLFSYIVYSVYGGQVALEELVNEFYIYVADDNWKKIRQFDFRSKLMTWVGVVAIRFFQKKREELIENYSADALIEKTACRISYKMNLETKMDVRQAIEHITNPRYREVIRKLDLQDCSPESVSEAMGITVDNLYNIHRRALLQLKLIMTRKEDYYD